MRQLGCVFFAVMMTGVPVVKALPRADPALARTWWAFQPLHAGTPPVVDRAQAPTAIDAYLVGGKGRSRPGFAPEADRRTWLRRATFGLTGLPPSAEEIDAFAADPSPDAFARAVDRLLSSTAYGEHWGRHWLDVVRYADTAGETADYPVPEAWRYRNYVIDAFNADKPYDAFLREQLAGDILARRGPRDRYAEQVTATGYLAVSRRFGFDSENYHHLTIQDTIDTLGQSVLGLSLGCARCHDHTFDPVTMEEYYALYGIFDSTRYAFPGSEQKQSHRALAPLCPPKESMPAWRAYEARAADLAKALEKAGKSAPAAVLRSLDDCDGDFEMQAPAAGGSNGVLVPPWIYEGPIAVTAEAQSPFQNLHARGRVGASVPTGAGHYRIVQALHPRRSRGEDSVVHVNVDFRVEGGASPGRHRFWLGSAASSAAAEIIVSADGLRVRTGNEERAVRALLPNEWHNLQLDLDLKNGLISGRAGRPGDVVAWDPVPLASDWDGVLDEVGFGVDGDDQLVRPSIAWDNLGLQDDAPMAAVSTEFPSATATASAVAAASLAESLRTLTGMDGDFELQDDGTAPAAPWGPGPNSVVQVAASAQSPFANLVPLGRLGIRLPNSGAYNGFGQTLPEAWTPARTPKIFVAFDFRCSDMAAGGNGTWRFYLGHGPGQSAAIELFINGTHFFRRSEADRDPVTQVAPGTWHQVRLALDLEARTYSGQLCSHAGQTPFEGRFATNWDGVIDYTFIDSYGHLDGVKPALEADNFVLSAIPLPSFEAPAMLAEAGAAETRKAQVAEWRRQQAAQSEAADRALAELEGLRINGPFALAYAMSEGTPRNARIHLRGEPSKPGAEVPRGFLSLFGGGPLPPATQGSGRLELAEWLIGPARALTARVMVNRIWQYHFGQGLVGTPNDFGVRGRRPDHPELLDYLAGEFIRQGWSVKAMHRLIMASAAYRQASPAGHMTARPADPSLDDAGLQSVSATLPAAAETTSDPAPGPLFSRRRLSAEETRDAILQVSGTLDPTPGKAHPFPSPLSWRFTQHGPFSAVYDHQRRSVYLMTQRIKRHPFLALFDGPDPNASTAERRTTTVPTQALYFLNDPFVHASSEAFADRVLTAADDDPGRIAAAYRLALGRPPSSDEISQADVFLAAYRAELGAAGLDSGPKPSFAALARVLFGSNEFLTVD